MVGNGRVQRQVNRAFMISNTLSTKGGGPNLRRGFRGAPPDLQGFWAITGIFGTPPDMRMDAHAPKIESAKAQLGEKDVLRGYRLEYSEVARYPLSTRSINVV
jgi:hypothetical protein